MKCILIKFQKKRGSSLGIILLGIWFLIALSGIYIINSYYNLQRVYRFNIISNIENSYLQPFSNYTDNFQQFCKERDFINSKFIPQSVYIIIPSTENTFNIQQIKDSKKIDLTPSPVDINGVFNNLAAVITQNSTKEKLSAQINSVEKKPILLYTYRAKKIYIERILVLRE